MSALASTSNKPKKTSFHATNVWNDLVNGFREKIELRKYRRNYFTATYEQCFTSNDAILCLMNVLKSHPNFENKQIERHHAVRLLEKFYESKVFTDVNKTDRRKTFQAENGIYQLLSKSDENIFQTVVVPNKSAEQNLQANQDSNLSAMTDGWKQYFLERLEKYLLKTRNRHGGYLLHQIEQEMKFIESGQLVENLQNDHLFDPMSIAGQLVDWLPESMLIVIDYPTSLEGRNLPDYPSFIFDLFEMVVDTFDMQRQYLTSSMTIFNLIFQLIVFKGNPLPLESIYDRDDGRSVNCFPSEIYASRSNNNPYLHGKHRSNHSKQQIRVPRAELYDYKKLQIHEDESKSFALTNLRRKSLSSCDLFHVTSKSLSSPFEEIANAFSVFRDTNLCSNEKITSDEFELIQLALVHLTTSNRQFLYVTLYFLVQCLRNHQFCPNETVKLRIQRSFSKLMSINVDETCSLIHVFDCFVEHFGKLFDLSMETRKNVSRRITKSKKENKPTNTTSNVLSHKKPVEERQARQNFKQLRVSRPLTYNEHLNDDTLVNASTTFIRKPFVPSPSTNSSTSSPRRRARSFEPRAHTTTLFDKTINPFQKLRVILKRNE